MDRADKHRSDRANEPDQRISVMSWLVEIGHAVAKKLKGVPSSPLARIHD